MTRNNLCSLQQSLGRHLVTMFFGSLFLMCICVMPVEAAYDKAIMRIKLYICPFFKNSLPKGDICRSLAMMWGISRITVSISASVV
jgi:hypothetical protein